MTKNKLKLKRTPEEEKEHQRKKERRREKKRKRDVRYDVDSGPNYASSSKRVHQGEDDPPPRKWASSDEEGSEFGPQPAPSSHTTDFDTIKAEIEEQMFRQKMFDAMGEDDRLDSVEARFNDFAQVPDRWRTTGTGNSRLKMDEDEFLKMDPSMLDDEEYAEWIRAGMKTHADEYAEQQRKKAAQEARKAERKARKAETARLEREAENERMRKRAERQSRKTETARVLYHARWAALLAPPTETEDSNAMLGFDDIPWPIFAAYSEKSHRDPEEKKTKTHSVTVEELTSEAISSFLLPVKLVLDAELQADAEQRKKERKEKLRETFLRFHPDKFEGRFSRRIKEEDKEVVREAIGQVSRVLNSLMGE